MLQQSPGELEVLPGILRSVMGIGELPAKNRLAQWVLPANTPQSFCHCRSLPTNTYGGSGVAVLKMRGSRLRVQQDSGGGFVFILLE
jgi:hypothetical protein